MNARLKQIYKVALVTFSEKGYHGTSLRDIAVAVDIQTPSLYNYFTGKQDLLFRLLKFIMEDLIDRTEKAVFPHTDDPVAALRAAIEVFVLFNVTHVDEAAVSDAGLSILSPEQRHEIVLMRDKFDRIYTDTIRVGMEKGAFMYVDATVTKNMITSACARIYMWYKPSGAYSPQELAQTVSDYLTAGLRRVSEREESR